MSSPVPAIDPSGREEPAPLDGWRNGDLPALRAELDRIDDAIHDLLMQRAEIVEHVARSGKPAAFRPGREASIIRRLLGRHRGELPPVALVRIWRELLAGTTGMQGGFSLAVCDADPDAPVMQLAREHFGVLTPLRCYSHTGAALREVSEGLASVAVLPYPSEEVTWWAELAEHEPRLHIIACLPFWRPRSHALAPARALVVALTPADASEADMSFLSLQCDSDVSRARLASELSAAGLHAEAMVLARSPGAATAHTPGAATAHLLIAVAGILAEDDVRLGDLGEFLRRPVVLGHYAVPVSGDER
jgi:chorismate mutase